MGFLKNYRGRLLFSLCNNSHKQNIENSSIYTNSQRRHLTTPSIYSFGVLTNLGDQEKKEEPPENNDVVRTPTKPNQEPEKDYLIPKAINPEARDLICQDIRDSGHQEQILKDFKEHFNLKVKQVRPENITLSEHGRFLRQAVEKYKDD